MKIRPKKIWPVFLRHPLTCHMPVTDRITSVARRLGGWMVRTREFVKRWIKCLVHRFEDDEVGLVSAVDTLLKSRKVASVLKGMLSLLWIPSKFSL